MLQTTQAAYFPNDNIAPSEKRGRQFNEQLSQAVWAAYCNDQTMFGYGSRAMFTELRSYSNGMQSAAPYREWFVGKKAEIQNQLGVQNTDTKGYANVDYRPFTVAPKFKGVLKSTLSASDWKVQFNSLNAASINQKSRAKWQMWIDTKLKDLRRAAGIPVADKYWEPSSEEELNLYEQMGGLKLTYETALEEITEHTFNISKWGAMRDRAIDDLIDSNFIVGRVYVDKASGATKVKHIKTAQVVMSWIDEDVDGAPSFIGHVEKKKIAEVKQELISAGYNEKEIEGLAKSYLPQQSNINQPWEYFLERDPVTDRFRYEQFNVDILHYEYLSYDTEYYVKRETSDGGYQLFSDSDRKIKKDYEDGRKRETTVIGNLTIYSGSCVCGTKFVYDYGQQVNVMKLDKDTVYSSYFFERVSGASITQRCLPLYDDMQKSWLKLQAAKWAASPKGFAIDIGSLKNIDLGSGVLLPIELIKIARQNGIRIYNTQMKAGKVISGQGAIQELEGGIGRQLDEWISSILFSISQIMEISGITPAVAATSANTPEKGLGVTQYEADATSHALYPLRNAIINYKEKAAKVIVMKTLLNIRFDERCREYYTKVLGQDKIEAILSVGDTTLEELAIQMESLPTQAEKAALSMKIDAALNIGKDGKGKISISDAFAVEELMRQNNLKFARWYLALSESRAIARDNALAQAQMEANGAVQIQSAQATIMAEVEKEKALMPIRLQEKAAAANIELQKESKLLQLKNDGVLEQITLEATLESQLGTELSGKV